MMRTRFENQLEKLEQNIVYMGGLSEEIIALSLEALGDATVVRQEEITKLYQQIEEMERDIEGACIKLLLRQQPVARDLRVISSALKLVYDLKRIGAQSLEISLLICSHTGPLIEDIPMLEKMADAVSQMVRSSLDALVEKNDSLTQEIIAKDATIDRYFDTIKEKLIHSLRQDSTYGDQAIHLLMIAKYLERIGDHAVNIAKWIHFAITGQLDGG